MFKTRLISGIILVALAILFIYSGGIVLAGVLSVLSLIGVFELLRVFKLQKGILSAVSYGFCVLYFVILYLSSIDLILFEKISTFFVVGIVLIILSIYVFTYPKYDIDAVSKYIFSFLYLPLMLGFVYLTRQLPKGQYIVWLIFLSSWGCDTCAYCVGVLFGRTKMSPILSPKKSVEGALGGVLGTIILTFIYCSIFKVQMGLEGNMIYIIISLCALSAFISMVGDLAASAIKRNYDIKDYGRLIPGHGGVLDRFDSMIITAPIIYLLGSTFL